MQTHELFYKILISLSYIIYISLLLGLTIIDSSYLSIVKTAIKWYIALYLLLRFNPYIKFFKISRSSSEEKIIFHSAVYLILSLIPYEHINKVIDYIKK